MENSDTVIVTGSAGMVGSALKKIVYQKQADDLAFNKKYNWVWLTRKDVDLEDYKKVYEHFENYDCENIVVINLAANVGGLFKNMDSNVEMFESNIRININILEACRKLKVPKVINILSTCIFPDVVEYPLTEDQINNGKPHDSNPGYSYSKRTGQIYSKLINDSARSYYNYVNLIPTNLYGNRDNYKIDDAHVIPAIIHKCFKIVKSRKEFDSSGGTQSDKLILPGDGKAQRMFLYDEDFAKVILDMACFKETRGDYIVSGGISDSVTISTLADIIATKVHEVTSRKIEIEFEDTELGNGQNKKPCSNQKLVNLYAEWNESIPIEDGQLEENIENVVSWFWNNYDEYHRK
tara:strand:- start:6033 stop:7085 length:1053 start_codon:yes stop_codon:yes gene_type:complete